MAPSLLAGPDRVREIVDASRTWPSLALSAAQAADLEMLLTGAFDPLRGFTGPVASGLPFPVTLELPGTALPGIGPGAQVALRDAEGVLLAALRVDETWSTPAGARGLAGPVEDVALPVHHDFPELRRSPAELRRLLAGRGWTRVLGVTDPYPPTPGMRDRILRAADAVGAGILLLPCVGGSSPLDPSHGARIRSVGSLIEALPPGRAVVSLLPFDARPGRLPLGAARVAAAFGCTHLLATPAEARGLEAAGLVPVPAEPAAPPAAEIDALLAAGRDLPAGLLIPSAEAHLRRRWPSRSRRGVTIFFTGLSGSGKSTVANLLVTRLLARGGRSVTLLDGDLVRRHLSSELGFSKEHRDLNIRRIGFVAGEVTRHGGVAVCSPIAPYDAVRKEVRRMIEALGGFLLVHMSAPLQVCESRDRKGLYAKARAGLLPSFTGISDPYEVPADAELTLDTGRLPAADCAGRILAWLEEQGYLA